MLSASHGRESGLETVMIHKEKRAMRRGAPQWIGMLIACVVIPGCLLNSVHQLKLAPRTKPDAAHAIVVIGLKDFSLILDEYSVKKQDITGNCYHYNRIEAISPSSPGKVIYFAYEVPAGTYVYSRRNMTASLDPPALGSGFIAPAAKTVYFGDYISVGHNTVEFRRDIDAARLGSRGLLPLGSVLESAEPTTTALTHPFLCTP
jgi:hypothetical protein